MRKKIFIFIILSLLITACTKKDTPDFLIGSAETNHKTQMHSK